MEDQTEKMEALKKAYAEMILNTAKEAAARTMASERKALRIHHDLRNTKDEALRMLLRFKQMIDVKTTEAETTSLGQQKRIDGLDAQLNETEGVIVNLRAEIRNAHERLKEVKNSHMLQPNEPSKNEHVHYENTAHDSQCSKRHNPAKETAALDNILIETPKLASTIIGSKEPELYRNGYTHRIRAIETNLVDENNISKDKPVEDNCTKNELIINVDEIFSKKCAASSIVPENTDTKNINGTQSLPRNSVRYAQSNQNVSRFCHGPSIKPTPEPEKLNLMENSREKNEKSTESNEQSACTLRRSIRKRKVRCWDDISSLSKSRAALSRCKNYSSNDDISKETKYDELSEDTTLLNEKHEIAAKRSDEVACDTGKNRLLKYTFSRRRKNVLSSKSDNRSSHENSFSTRKMGEKTCFSPGNEKHGLIEDMSSDRQAMVDVACQLISLSQARSW